MIRSSAVRIGVAGVGSLGFHHARITRELEGVVAAGVFDSDRARMDTVATELGTPAHSSLESLLDASDAVVVAVPTTAHEEVAVAALDRGLSVMIEKPIAPDLAAADRILAAAARTGAMVQIGHVERFNPALLSARDRLSSVQFIECHRLAPFKERGADVNVVLDLMIHDIDVILSLVTGKPSLVSAVGISVLTSSVDIANARIEFDTGAIANVTASRVSTSTQRKFRVFQKHQYLAIDFGSGDIRLVSRTSNPGNTQPGLDEEKWNLDKGDALAAEVGSFVNSIVTDMPCEVSGDDGVAALELAEAIIADIQQREF